MIPLGMKLIPEDEAFRTEREERERKKGEEARKRKGRGRKTPSREPNQTDGTLPDHVWMPSQHSERWVDTGKIA